MKVTRPDVVLDWRPNPRHWLTSTPFRFSQIPMCAKTGTRTRIRRTKTQWLDQGREGACTGFGAEHARALSPKSRPTNNDLARLVYYNARKEDEWPGEDYEGSSVNGAMRAERSMGLIKSWMWARTVNEAKHGVSYHAAGEGGFWWWTGMFDTDSDGFIHVTGYKEGGHALAYAGYEPWNGTVRHRLENSWGSSWGDNGGCWITEFDLMQLLNDDGELAFPQKVF